MTRLTRSNSVLPLAAAVATAAALTGAAVFTVVRIECVSPSQYIQRDGVVELIGGCVEHDDLPVGPRQPNPGEQSGGGAVPAGA